MLSIATRGYLCENGVGTPGTIAVRGYLGCTSIIIPIPEEEEVTGGSSRKRKARIKEYNDEAIMMTIKVFLKCQDENIL